MSFIINIYVLRRNSNIVHIQILINYSKTIDTAARYFQIILKRPRSWILFNLLITLSGPYCDFEFLKFRHNPARHLVGNKGIIDLQLDLQQIQNFEKKGFAFQRV